ncbi:YwaF family protein [Neobacillus sp. D3-1R]|uniref:YwaF family protein n=1 Tax=Neobacillus sp. D3-1R TaxID=3445778 RepID=UPI003FA063CD
MFSVTEMRDFTIFSMTHLVTLLLFFIAYFLFIYYRKRLKPYQRQVKWTLFSILVVCEISHHLWLILINDWEVADLPIQLCSLSTFLAIFLFLKPNKKVFHLLFFIGTIPPILAMVTPDMVYQFPHFRFLKYFIHHSAIPIAVLYFILFEGYRVPRKAIFTSFLTLNMIAVPVFILNIFLDTNFFFLANPAETKTLLNFFGTGIMYYISLESAALVTFILTYLPMGRLMKRERKLESRQPL